jgi:O-antigen/teichoic acid export membrane protein
MNASINARIKPLLKVMEYKYFILESLPQLGIVLFDSALARIDWILLGILSTAAATAEYSFTYKVFELSKIPLLIVAPILLTRFSKLFSNDAILSPKYRKELAIYFRLEIFMVMFIPLGLVASWTPLIDYFTDNKYGAVNETNYLILALCVPLHAIINFLWTLGFVQGQLKTIMYITIAVSLMNIAANIFYIPSFGSRGAALAFFTCTVLQLAHYMKFIRQDQFRIAYSWAILAVACAIAAWAVSRTLHVHYLLATLVAIILYSLLSYILNRKSIQALINRKYDP